MMVMVWFLLDLGTHSSGAYHCFRFKSRVERLRKKEQVRSHKQLEWYAVERIVCCFKKAHLALGSSPAKRLSLRLIRC